MKLESDNLEVTITYLEMMAQPEGPSEKYPSVGKSISLLRAQPPSIQLYRYLYETIGEKWLWYERRELSDKLLSTIIEDPLVEIYVLHVGNKSAGYIELDRRLNPEIELAYFGLMPEFLGFGLGRWLLDSALRISWRYQPKRVWLHTCTLDHPAALRLYKQAGFVEYSQETKQICDPRVTGLFC